MGTEAWEARRALAGLGSASELGLPGKEEELRQAPTPKGRGHQELGHVRIKNQSR